MLRTYRIRLYDREICAEFKKWYKSKGYKGSVKFRRGKMLLTTHWTWGWQSVICEFFDDCIGGTYSTNRDTFDSIDLKLMLFTEQPTNFFCWLEVNGYENLYMSAYDLSNLADEFHARGSQVFS